MLKFEYMLKFGVFNHLYIILDNDLEFDNTILNQYNYELLGIKSIRISV